MLQTYKKDIEATLTLAIPVIIGQLGQVLMGNIDTMMLGEIGHVAVSAAGLANSVFFLFVVIGFGTMSVIAPLTAEANATENNTKSRSFLIQGIWISLVLGLLMSIFLYFVPFIFEHLDQPEEDRKLAAIFLRIISFSTIPMYVFIALKSFTDGLSDTRPAMYITLIGLVINTLLNYLLIKGHWGFPGMGIAGSAWATTISRFFMMFLLGLWVLKGQNYKKFQLLVADWKFDKEPFMKILKLGVPSGMQYFFEIGSFVGVVVMIGWMGEHASQYRAAHQIAISMAALSYMVSLGLSSAATIRVGDALGRKNIADIRRAGNIGLALALMVMGIAAIIFVLGKNWLPALYQIEDPFVLQTASDLLIIAAIFQLFDGTQVIGLGILRGIQDVKFPTFVTFVGYWLISLPVAYYLGITLNMNVQGAWYSFVIGLAFAAFFNNIRFYYLVNKMAQKI